MVDFIAKLVGKDADTLYREWHSFWIGFSEMVCLRIPPLVPVTDHILNEISCEWHWYAVGRASGVLTWVALLSAIL